MTVTAAALSLTSVVVGSVTFGFLVGMVAGLGLGALFNK